MTAMRPVGILGGMGPQATVLLMQKVIDAVPARDDADHVPLIVHQNPSVPSRIAALIEGTGPSPLPVLQAMARDLSAAGATALAIPCNTAHAYAGDLRGATDLPLLDMLALTGAALADKGRIGVLASPATRLSGVFDGYLPPGFAFPDDDAPLLAMIRAVKAGVAPDAIAERLESQATRLMQTSDHLMIACTELSLAAPLLPAFLPRTDSLDCLVAAIVEHARGTPV